MDNNTADVLKSLIGMAGLSSIFWAAALGMRWQAGYVIPDGEDEEGDDEDEETLDTGAELVTAEVMDESDDEYGDDTCPGVDSCPYHAEFRLRYGMEDRKVLDTAIWYGIGIAGALAIGFIAGLLLARVQSMTFGSIL